MVQDPHTFDYYFLRSTFWMCFSFISCCFSLSCAILCCTTSSLLLSCPISSSILVSNLYRFITRRTRCSNTTLHLDPLQSHFFLSVHLTPLHLSCAHIAPSLSSLHVAPTRNTSHAHSNRWDGLGGTCLLPTAHHLIRYQENIRIKIHIAVKYESRQQTVISRKS